MSIYFSRLSPRAQKIILSFSSGDILWLCYSVCLGCVFAMSQAGYLDHLLLLSDGLCDSFYSSVVDGYIHTQPSCGKDILDWWFGHPGLYRIFHHGKSEKLSLKDRRILAG